MATKKALVTGITGEDGLSPARSRFRPGALETRLCQVETDRNNWCEATTRSEQSCPILVKTIDTSWETIPTLSLLGTLKAAEWQFCEDQALRHPHCEEEMMLVCRRWPA
jgi:hypothetical protein